MKKLFIVILFFCVFQQVTGQDSISYRIILIGNAGEINAQQKAIVENAARQAVAGKTIALFLGNNIMPKGIELPGDKAEQTSQDILRSQYESLRKKEVPVYFVPGNYDWDNSGPDGYKKMIRLNEFIKEQNDSSLQVIPKDACPGPYELALSGKLVLVAMDSEWWLYPFNKRLEESDCECKTKRDILSKLNDILQRNYDKIIIFATNHPFKSYGIRGGYHPFKKHVFPLTNFNKNLYIPLPVVGSVYPLFRKTFPPAEDLNNNAYEDMSQGVAEVLKTHPNVIHVSGHEHSLQLIQSDVLEVVSGAASKITAVKQGNGSLYAQSAFGYAVADVLTNNTIYLSYFTLSGENIQPSFTFNKEYAKPVSPAYEDSNKVVVANNIKMSLGDKYDKVSGIHKSLFGENYRKVWATETTFPVLRLSATDLKPKELGGGMQTYSLRLTDKQNRECVFRSIEKYPANIIPEAIRTTFFADILNDNVTAIFPYAPLTVPVFANALGVPHSNPKIVYIAPDKKLGIYSRDFANTICLLEEREPLGKSLSTINMMAELKQDNDNSVDQKSFLTARLQDIFLADWDRHGDQWRWVDVQKGNGKIFKGVPRDRDQIFYINNGLLPKFLALPWVMPKFQGFGERVKNINALSFNARFIDGIFTNRLSAQDWTTATNAAVAALTDSVIETALKRMPAEIYEATHVKLADQLKKRRQDLLRTTPHLYRFLNKIIDIPASDKNELVTIKDTLNGKLLIRINKLSKNNEAGKELYNRVLEPLENKEVRLYLFGGEDSVSIQNSSSSIKLRIIGDGKSAKRYSAGGSSKYLGKVHIYDGTNNTTVTGITYQLHQPLSANPAKHLHLHLSDDPSNTSLQLTNRYNNTVPLINFGYNVDDGLILGGGVKFIRQRFRKQPYGSVQQITFAHSFSTEAFRFNYAGEWVQAIGKADFLIYVKALAPDNTQNFFGRGNGTEINKTGNYKKYYRTRFSLYQAEPALRWLTGKNTVLTTGPSFQYYRYDADDNKGRFITDDSKIHTYDSASVENDKTHGGIVISLTNDSRNNSLLPTSGTFVNFRLQSYKGLNNYSKSFGQLIAEFAFYRGIGRKAPVVIANRLGGGVTVGKTAFYQSLFLGGHENVRGFHQYRFAGEHMIYNNLEARIRLANVASYILPGQLGVIAFYDVGRVWQKGYNNKILHHGAGGGLYFTPAQVAVFQFVLGSSKEGLYPYFTMGFRF